MKWIILAVVFLGIGVAVFCRYRDIRYAESHNLMHTRTDLRLISERLRLAVTLEPSEILAVFSNRWDATNLYKFLSMTNNGVRLLQPRYDWDSANAVLDSWGRPVRINLEKSEGQAKSNGLNSGIIRIWSVGPNGNDEGGAGDDILELVEISAK